MEKINQSPQYGDDKFSNPKTWTPPSFHLSLIWKFLFEDNDRTPKTELPVQTVDLSSFNRSGDNQLNVTWVGHSTLLINIDGYRIITDPVLEKSLSILGPSRYNGDVPLDIEQLESIDAVVISHNHYDHLNKFSIKFINERTRLFFVPLAVGAELEGWGVPREKIIELDWWDEYNVDGKLTLAATPAQHFSGRSMTDRDSTLWASWVIQAPDHKIYFSGDSGYFDGFKQIGQKYGPFDITFLECGAYDKRWSHIHMFPEETVKAHLDLKGKVLHPIHWGTFNLGLHPWHDPMERLEQAAQKAEVRTVTPIVGGASVYDSHLPEEKWWKPYLPNKSKKKISMLQRLRKPNGDIDNKFNHQKIARSR